MANQELEDFSVRQQREKRWTMIAFIGGTGLVLLLFLYFSSGSTSSAYSFGSSCDSDCGQNAGNALLCLRENQEQNFCSQPCGENYPTCPGKFECRELAEDSIVANRHNRSKHDSYCFKTGVKITSAGQQAGAVQGASLAMISNAAGLAQVDFEKPAVVQFRGNPVVTGVP